MIMLRIGTLYYF